MDEFGGHGDAWADAIFVRPRYRRREHTLVKTCTQCGRPFEGEGDLCPRCTLTAPRENNVSPEETALAEPVPPQPEAEDPPESMTISRRRFLSTGLFALGGVMGVGYLGLALRYLLPNTAPRAVPPRRVGSASSFPVNTPVLTVVEENGVEDGVFVVNTGKDFVALDFHCPHLNCPLNWYPGVDGIGRYICPCHGSQFTVTGDHVAGPAPHAMWKHEVQVKNGQVYIGSMES